MSTNLNIFAQREIEVVKTGARQTQQVAYRFTWQPPTEVTKKIMQATNRKQAYIDWVLSISIDWVLIISKDEIVNTYEYEDVFCDNPVGTEVYNSGKEHIIGFTAWCNYMEKEGYEIKFESW